MNNFLQEAIELGKRWEEIGILDKVLLESQRLTNEEPTVCEKCNKRQSIKTGDHGEWLCHHCAAGLPEPFRKQKTQGRNEKCACKSGKKFKYCCLRNNVEKEIPRS